MNTSPKQVSLGLGIGSAVLFYLGAPIVLPAVAAGSALYYYKKSKDPNCAMTPERKKIYEEALKSLKDPVKLEELALGFEKGGCPKQAELLRKRAKLRTLPKDVQKGRKEALKAGYNSTDPKAVETLAAAFEGEGATGAAEGLRVHASALRTL